MLTINSNISARRAERQLANASAQLSTTFERMSSGLRINRASDDAAGLAVAVSLNAETRIYQQSIRNLSDGISAISIADGAFGNLSGVLIRIKELSEQSANGTYSSTQRSSLDREAQALRNEYNRIVDTTSFNGISLLKTTEQIRLQAKDTRDAAALYFNTSGVGVGFSGDGTFEAGVQFGMGTFNYSTTTADIDNDGDLDVITRDGTFFSVMQGNDDGTFLAPTTFANVGALVGTPGALAVRDVNGDNKLDVITTGDGSAWVHLGNADGTFNTSVSYVTGTFLDLTQSIDIADVNGDTYLDLLVGNRTRNSVMMLTGNSNGTFNARVTIAGFTSITGLVVADINGDNKKDLVGVSIGSDIFVRLGNNDGTFNAAVSYQTPNGTDHMISGYFNGDSILDLAITNTTTDTIDLFFGNSDGSFSAVYSLYVGVDPYDLATGDFNGDGKSDIAIAKNASGLAVFLNNGDGTFKAQVTYGTAAGSITTGDINGDSVTDIISGTTSSVSVLMGNGESSYYLSVFDLTTQSGARSALDTISSAIDSLALTRGRLGAQESRISVALRNIYTSRLGTSAAASRIMDADIAQESASYTRLKILQDAAVSVLGQANVQPSVALLLIQ